MTNDSKGLFQETATEAHQLLQQATDRFSDVMQTMKLMSAEMQRELESTRQELRRGVLELPEETAESTAQMRRVIVDQMEALAELNRIATSAPYRTREGNDTPAASAVSETALVPVAAVPQRSRWSGQGHLPSEAPFLAHLIATVEQIPQTRTLRRATPNCRRGWPWCAKSFRKGARPA